MKLGVTEKYDNALKIYTDTTHAHTNMLAMTKTRERDKVLRELEGQLLEIVDIMGYLLEEGDFPYGQDVARLIFTVPDYRVPAHMMKTAGLGLKIALKTGMVKIELSDKGDRT